MDFRARVLALPNDETHLSSSEYSETEAQQFEILGETFSIAHPNFWVTVKGGMSVAEYALFRFKVPLIDMDADDSSSRRVLRMLALHERIG